MITEYRERGLGHLAELAEEAREMGLEVETRVEDGPFLETVRSVARSIEATRIIAARLARPHVSRLFFGSEVDRLVRDAPCPVDLFDWTGSPLLSGSG